MYLERASLSGVLLRQDEEEEEEDVEDEEDEVDDDDGEGYSE